MSIKRITLIFSVLLFAQSSFAKKDTKTEIFPLQQLTGNTDSMLINKYIDADTASFRILRNPSYIYHMPYYSGTRDRRSAETLEKERVSTIQKKRSKYPKSKIRNIGGVDRWLREVYHSHYPCEHVCCCYILSRYKQVEDGFLIAGRKHFISDALSKCETIEWEMYLVGYDHNIVSIKKWEINLCPWPETRINVETHFPEFEDTEVCYPELSGHNIDSLLLKNIRYPVIAIDYRIKGKVLVSLIVETDGSVSNIEVVNSVELIEAKLTEKEAVRCVRLTDGKWIPGIKNGEKTPMEIKIEFDFVLEEVRRNKYDHYNY